VSAHADEIGGNASRLFVSGHSAGGHIVGMMLTSGLERGMELIKGSCAISGLFDLEPIRHTFLNVDLRLEEDMSRRNSPTMAVKPTDTPLILSVGALESDEFHRQTHIFRDAWTAAGNRSILVEAPDRNHYSVLDDFADAARPLAAATLRQMGLR
jgi:arylformamidase